MRRPRGTLQAGPERAPRGCLKCVGTGRHVWVSVSAAFGGRSMKRFALAAAVVVGAALAAPAFAQGKTVQEADKTVFRKKTTIDFTDVAVEGELTKPEGTYALSKKKTNFK